MPEKLNPRLYIEDVASGTPIRAAGTDRKYVHIRRLLAYIERSIGEGTQWAVFEPDDEATWSRVRGTIGDFLAGVWKAGELQGTTPDEAYFVRCDRTTMTQNDIDNGRLIALVGVAPVRPAEFVIVRIGLWAQDPGPDP